jgi:glycosyltransferase involved in cell wall biosynthesis
MRIAHYVHRYPPALGGAEAYFARLSNFMTEHGNQVTVFTSNAVDLTAFWSRRGLCLPAGETSESGIRIRRYPLWHCPGRRYLLKLLSLFPNQTWRCATLPCNPISWSWWRDAGHPAGAFDLVHASAFPYAFPILCGLRLARRLRVPFFVTPFLHLGDLDDPSDRTRAAYTSPALMSLLHAADGIFVQTPSERQALLQRGVAPDRIILQGLGVDAAECTGGVRQRARSTWQIGADVPVVGHLANNSEEKGTVDLLRAATLLWERGLDFRVVLAGPHMPNFLHFWHTFRYRNLVCCLGRVDEQGRTDFFAGIDLFALPSRSDSFGLVLLEAWANGLANLAYRAGGVADVIRHEEDGLLCGCGDIAALASALETLLRRPNLRTRLGQSGKKRILTEFRWLDKLELVRSAYLNKVQRHAYQPAHCSPCP